jgi:adenine-specific DNA-methyltransferase
MDNVFLKTQIPTYMGNKRKLLTNINEILTHIESKLQKKLILGDGFSGSGIVSRLFKTGSSELYTNDIAGYSQTLNQCFLSTPQNKTIQQLEKIIEQANNYADNSDSLCDPWIQSHWCAQDENNIQENDRVYYTRENAIRIDKYRYFINHFVEKSYCHYLLAVLLVEASIHSNTNGQFSAFYKKDGKGAFGGKTGTDIHRITKKIELYLPNFSPNKNKINISQQDTNEWIKTIPEVDVMYYDPPYNKHPYSIYYFMLDIINNWDLNQEIPSTYRGQPKTWIKSKYNSFKHAAKVFEDLIKNTKAKYIMISYNNGGIIPLSELDKILTKYGNLEKIPVTHKTYNKLKGIANYKRKKASVETKEFIWLLEMKH